MNSKQDSIYGSSEKWVRIHSWNGLIFYPNSSAYLHFLYNFVKTYILKQCVESPKMRWKKCKPLYHLTELLLKL